MRLNRSTSSLLASTALLAAPFASASAVERNLLTWSGRVDREVVIRIHGRDVATNGSGLDASWAPRVNVDASLPMVPGVVRAYRQDGRGEVEVLENPSPRNNYTATIRIRDTRSGADNYRVVVMYEVNDPRGPIGRGDDRDGGWNGGRGDRDDDRDRGPGRRGPDRDRDGVEWDRNRRDAGALKWSGMVDGVAEIRIQGSRIDALADQGNRLRDVRYDVLGSSLPRRDVRLEMVNTNGRGRVTIVQQPSVWNQYIAIVRIEDRRSGYGEYGFVVRW